MMPEAGELTDRVCLNCGAEFQWPHGKPIEHCPSCKGKARPQYVRSASDSDWTALVKRVREAVRERRGDC